MVMLSWPKSETIVSLKQGREKRFRIRQLIIVAGRGMPLRSNSPASVKRGHAAWTARKRQGRDCKARTRLGEKPPLWQASYYALQRIAFADLPAYHPILGLGADFFSPGDVLENNLCAINTACTCLFGAPLALNPVVRPIAPPFKPKSSVCLNSL
jgi:hypothetical protein